VKWQLWESMRHSFGLPRATAAPTFTSEGWSAQLEAKQELSAM
jgi:hypothetical protein